MDGRQSKLKDYYVGAAGREESLKAVSIPNGDVIQFGVFSGSSMAFAHHILKDTVGYSKMWGFDSFEGLPDEQAGLNIAYDWIKGSFNAKEWFEIDNKNKIVDRLYKEFVEFGVAFHEVELIDGWFSDTLTDELAEFVRPASYIDVDSDLYISAYQAMDWVFRNKLAVSGTVIYYDDWLSGKERNAGEYKAHYELINKYQVNCKQIKDGATATFVVQ